jgi:hypothetical protein
MRGVKMYAFGMAGGPVRPLLVKVRDEEVDEQRKMLATWQPVL